MYFPLDSTHANTPDFSHQYGFLPVDLPGLGILTELALDLQWSWKHAADALWQQLDAELWNRHHNPWVMLQTSSREVLTQHLADPTFRGLMADLMAHKQQAAARPKWFAQQHPVSALGCMAYSSI